MRHRLAVLALLALLGLPACSSRPGPPGETATAMNAAAEPGAIPDWAHPLVAVLQDAGLTVSATADKPEPVRFGARSAVALNLEGAALLAYAFPDDQAALQALSTAADAQPDPAEHGHPYFAALGNLLAVVRADDEGLSRRATLAIDRVEFPVGPDRVSSLADQTIRGAQGIAVYRVLWVRTIQGKVDALHGGGGQTAAEPVYWLELWGSFEPVSHGPRPAPRFDGTHGVTFRLTGSGISEGPLGDAAAMNRLGWVQRVDLEAGPAPAYTVEKLRGAHVQNHFRDFDYELSADDPADRPDLGRLIAMLQTVTWLSDPQLRPLPIGVPMGEPTAELRWADGGTTVLRHAYRCTAGDDASQCRPEPGTVVVDGRPARTPALDRYLAEGGTRRH